eukprot:sb/3477014/
MAEAVFQGGGVLERQLRWRRASKHNQQSISPLPSLNNTLLRNLTSGIGNDGVCVVVRREEREEGEEVRVHVWIVDSIQVNEGDEVGGDRYRNDEVLKRELYTAAPYPDLMLK